MKRKGLAKAVEAEVVGHILCFLMGPDALHWRAHLVLAASMLEGHCYIYFADVAPKAWSWG